MVWDHEVARSSRVSRTKIIIFMEDFIKDPNPFCIQIVEGYIIQATPSDSKSCLALINLAIIAYVNLEEITQQK